MKIFVWKSHGDVSVYAAETPEQLNSILETMSAVVKDWGYMDKTVELCEKHAAKHPEDADQLRRCIVTMLNQIDVGSDETFEYGTGFSELQMTCS